MYSIKTDLGVLGDSTLEKALLVKGDAVFKQNVTVEGTVTFADATFTQITVTGNATFANITASGDTNLKNLATSGNTVLGDASTDTVVVNGVASFAAPVSLASDLTQSAGTATLKNVTADTITVSGLSKLNGNLEMLPTSTATLGDVDTQDLTVNGVTLIKGTSTFEQKATFGDVEINGVLSGTVTMDNGQFTNLTVSNDSTLNKLSVTGNAVFGGNITGLNSTGTLANLTMNGQSAIITFNYNDSAHPTYIKSSIQPYKVSTQEIQTNIADITRLEVGEVGDSDSTNGLHSLGKATMDYVAIKGNSTIGTSQPQLTVAGTSVFSGKMTVGDLEITGAVSGLTFDDITVNSLTVNGTSSLQNVTMSGNLTALNSTATIQNVTMNGQNAVLTFNYTDSANPSYIKSSIQPYKVSSHEFQGDIASIRELTTGVVNDSIIGHKGLGVNELDYVHVKGNSTIGTARKQLIVDGDSQFASTMTVNNIVVTGTTTGITADVAGADITPNSVTAAAGVDANTLESTTTTTVGTDLTVLNGTATIKDLVVTGTTTGVTVEANVDGLDIAPKSVAATTTVSVGTDLTVTGETNTNGLTVNGVAGGTGGNALLVSGISTAGAITTTKTGTALDVTNNAHIGGTLTVDGNTSFGGSTGSTTIHNLVVTGTTTGVTAVADVDGLDIKPASVESTGIVSGTNITASGILQGNSLNVTTDGLIGGDLQVTGTLVAGVIDLSTTELNAASITTTGNATIGGDTSLSGTLSVTGNVLGTLKTTNITTSGTLSVSGSSTLNSVTVSGLSSLNGLDVSGISTFNGNITSANPNIVLGKDTSVNGNLSVLGTLTAGSIDLSGTAISAASLNTTGNVHVGGDLTVDGTFDLSATNVSAASLESTGNTTVGGELVLTTGTVTGSPSVSGNLSVTGTTTLTGNTTVGGLAVGGPITKSGTGNLAITPSTDFAGNVTVNGTLTPAGGLDLSGTNLDVNSITTTAGATVGTTLGVTGASTLSGGLTTSTITAGGLITAQAGINTTTLATTGAISSATTITSTGRTIAGEVQVGGGTFDNAYKLNVTGNSVFNGDVFISGKLNGSIDLSGVDLNPRNVTASGTGSFAGTLTAGDTLTAPTAILGASGSTNNNLQVNGNVVTTGNFTVGGVIIGTLDQSTSNVTVGTLTTALAGGITIGGNGPLVLGSGGVITGAPNISGNTAVGGTFRSTGLITAQAGITTTTLTATGTSTLAGVSATTLSVSGASTLTGNTTVGGTLGVTGTTTVNNLTVNGTLTADIAGLVTNSISTKRYTVKPMNVGTTVTSGSWTPDGTSNVYNVTVTGATQIGNMPNPSGEAGSWFIYLTNTDGGAISMGSAYAQPLGEWGTTPGGVTICQIVYCGVGSIYDVFLSQRA